MSTELFRTLRAAVVAALLAFAMIGGIAWFLGFPTSTALVSGAVAAVFSLLLLLGAAKRSGHLEREDVPPPP